MSDQTPVQAIQRSTPRIEQIKPEPRECCAETATQTAELLGYDTPLALWMTQVYEALAVGAVEWPWGLPSILVPIIGPRIMGRTYMVTPELPEGSTTAELLGYGPPVAIPELLGKGTATPELLG